MLAAVTRSSRPPSPAPTYPAVSIKYYGDAAFHSKPKTPGAPATYEAYTPPYAKWTKRKWDVDHIQYTKEGLGPAHVVARERAGH